MPIEISDVDAGLGNIITATGVIPEERYLETLRAFLTQDPEKFAKYRFSLANYCGLAGADFSNDTIQMIADMCIAAAEKNPDIVVATVADNDLAFGLARMWEMLSDSTSWEIHVFRRLEQARAWIKKRVKERWNIADITLDGP